MRDRRLSKHTQRSYLESWGHWVEWLRRIDKNPRNATASDFARWLAWLTGQARSRGTVQTRRAGVRAGYKYRQRVDIDYPNPVAAVPLPASARRPAKERRVLSVEQIEALLSLEFDDATGLRDWALLELAYAAGMRADELCRLDWEHLDLQAGVVRIFGKGEVERVRPVGKDACEALLELRGPGSRGPVFLGPSGERLNYEQLRTLVMKRGAQAGVEWIRPHDLRRAVATHLLEAGMGIREVQEFLGHASIKSTQAYAKPGVEWLKTEVGKLHGRSE